MIKNKKEMNQRFYNLELKVQSKELSTIRIAKCQGFYSKEVLRFLIQQGFLVLPKVLVCFSLFIPQNPGCVSPYKNNIVL